MEKSSLANMVSRTKEMIVSYVTVYYTGDCSRVRNFDLVEDGGGHCLWTGKLEG